MMARACAVLVLLAWVQFGCNETVNNSSTQTQPGESTPSTVHSASAPRRLPKGFVAVEGTRLDPSGCPTEIRCLKDDSIMVFVPGGRFVSGLTEKQFETLARMHLDLEDPHWNAVGGPDKSLDDILKEVKPGKLVKQEDLKDPKKLSKSQKAAIASLGALQDTGMKIPAEQLDKWRSSGRTFSGLLRLPAVQEKVWPPAPAATKAEDYEKLVDQVFATSRERRERRLQEQIRELGQSLRPAKRGIVGSFYVDKYEVTNRQYRKFFAQADDPERRPGLWYGPTYNLGGPENPKFYDLWKDSKHNADDQPVTCVGKKDALAYAKWAGKQIPTRDEWERAATGDGGQLFPWGSDYKVGYCRCAVKPPRQPTTRSGRVSIGEVLSDVREFRQLYHELREGHVSSKVGRFPHDVSPYGCRDMAGNVSEWVILSSRATREEPTLVPMGGCAASLSLEELCPAMERAYQKPGKLVGFRTILHVDPPKP